MYLFNMIKIDIIRKTFNSSEMLYCCYHVLHNFNVLNVSLHSAIILPYISFIMLVSILLFQYYSQQICNLVFSIVCQHNSLRLNKHKHSHTKGTYAYIFLVARAVMYASTCTCVCTHRGTYTDVNLSEHCTSAV